MNFKLRVKWSAFPLHPETPPAGQSLEDLFASSPIDLQRKLADFKKVAAAEGLPFGRRTHTYNSRLAQELAKWAEAEGAGEAFHDAVFRAYFADGKNLAKIEVLIALAEAVDLPAGQAEAVLMQRSFSAAVDADWDRSRRLGITAVPTFLCDDRRIVGAQPYDVLARLVAPKVA